MMANQKPVALSGVSYASKNGKKLLDRASDALLAEGFAEAVARRYVSWMREYIVFHDKRHPQEMGVPEVRAFLDDARFSGQSGQRVEATGAIRFLYEMVLQRHWPRGALETEKTYVDWIKQYIHFHGTRNPEEMGALEVELFLTYLAVERKVAKDTQRQALNALVFLYRTVFGSG